VAHRSYEVAGVQFGVRTNAEGVADWLDETFGAFQVDDETAPYYSIVFGASENGNVGTSFHILYEESRALVRTLDLSAVAEVLIGQFEHVAASERSDAVFLDSAAVRLGDVLAIVPPIIPPYLANLSRRVIDRTGLKLPGTTYVALELGSGRLIPTSPTLDIAPDAAGALAELAPHKRKEVLARVEEPQWADLVVFIGLAEEPIMSYPQGRAVHLLATRILNIEQVGGRGIETVAAIVREAPAYEMRSSKVDQTLETLVELLSAPASAP
jgi:hypothetical protein